MPRQPQQFPLTPLQISAVAVAAHCDGRTVRAYLERKRTLPAIAASIERALEQLGHQELRRPAA